MRQAGKGLRSPDSASSNSFFIPYLPCVQAPWQLVAVVPSVMDAFSKNKSGSVSRLPIRLRNPTRGGTERERRRENCEVRACEKRRVQGKRGRGEAGGPEGRLREEAPGAGEPRIWRRGYRLHPDLWLHLVCSPSSCFLHLQSHTPAKALGKGGGAE